MNTMRIYRGLAGIASFSLCILLLARPTSAAVGFVAGLDLCAKSILPSLFPFFILSGIIMKSGLHRIVSRPLAPLIRLCGIQSKSAPGLLLLSWLGGYAVCAAVIRDALADESIASKDATLLLLLGCCSSPGFVIGCVGGQMLGSVQWGILLYFFQLSASLLTAALLLPLSPRLPSFSASCAPPGTQHSALLDSAVHSSLCVCGCVLFFRTVTSVLDGIVHLSAPYSALLCGALEISSGCFAFSQLNGALSLYGICVLLSVLSLSVFAQIAALLHAPFALLVLGVSRFLHLVIFLGEVRLALAVLPPFSQAEVFSTLAPRVVTSTRIAPDAVLCIILFFCCMLYNFSYNIYNRKKEGGTADVQKNNLRK